MIEKHDKKSLQPMLLKGYHHLHLMINCLNHKADEDCSLDIFDMIVNTSELVKELINIELLIFRRFHVGPLEIKCLIQWWQKHEFMFLTIGFLVQQILRIIRSQIKTRKIFSLASIFTNLRRCHL